MPGKHSTNVVLACFCSPFRYNLQALEAFISSPHELPGPHTRASAYSAILFSFSDLMAKGLARGLRIVVLAIIARTCNTQLRAALIWFNLLQFSSSTSSIVTNLPRLSKHGRSSLQTILPELHHRPHHRHPFNRYPHVPLPGVILCANLFEPTQACYPHHP
jgi:hypothetical protein